MRVTPLPRIGEVIVGRDVAGRTLRISWHPADDRMVLSVWQDAACVATVRLAGDDIGHLAAILTTLAATREDQARRAG